MLITTARHTPADLIHWMGLEAQDARLAQLPRSTDLERQAVRDIEEWVAAGPTYAGFSGGKDSAALVGLIGEHRIRVPVVRVVVRPMGNPEIELVRDRLLDRYDLDYHEIVVDCQRGPDGEWLGTGRLREGFRRAAQRFGSRYISGVRGDESGARQMRMRRWGVATTNTCAPLIRWTAADIFAFLYRLELPVHPCYAYTCGGSLDRDWLRVATLGGDRGRGMGRAEWERTYYGPELRALGLL